MASPAKQALSGLHGRSSIGPWLAVAAVGIALLWAYWPVLWPLYRDWQRDDNYSVGQLVPLAALYMVWDDRKRLVRCRVRPSGWGLGLMLPALAAWAYGLIFMFESAARYSFVLMIAALVLFLAGTQVFRAVQWILAFLLLMVPLPGRIHNTISGPLQDFATTGAVFMLELLGVSVTREGNTMTLNHTVPIGVAEACSGLRMLTAFVVVAAVLAYVIRRPVWQKAVVVISSVPVAIFCNLVRLVVTAFLFLWVDGKTAERFFHDFAGWTMMPIAVFILVGELWLLSHLVIDDERATSAAGL